MVKAVGIPPSQAWAGNDGTWSTFNVQIGSNQQSIEVLPSTSGQAIWVVLDSPPLQVSGCENQPFTNALCSNLRGGLFNFNESSSYQYRGEGDLPFEPEEQLGGNYSMVGNNVAKAYLGSDEVQIGFNGEGAGPVLNDQAIITYVAKTPYLGLLGLAPRLTNYTVSDTLDSPLQSLVWNNDVPSSYWAYNAGAYYRNPQQYGSLTLGGYDERLANKKEFLTVPFAADDNRNLLVQVDQMSIGSSSAAPILIQPNSPIVSFIDSVVPEIWLPQSICDRVADAFGLQYNDYLQMYMVNGTQYDQISQQNQSLTLEVSAPREAGSSTKSIQVQMPYQALVQNASYPLAGILDGSTVYYFAMKPAAAENQYTLGRVFLQEAYLAADYDNQEFFLSQAMFSTKGSIKTVHPKSSGSFAGSSGLSSGAIAGIAVGVVLGLLAIIGGLIWVLCGRRWYKRHYAANTTVTSRKSRGLSQSTYSTAPGDVTEFYTDDAKRRHMEEEESTRDVAAKTGLRMELDATQTARGRFFQRQELESPPIPMTPWSAASTKHGSVDGASTELGGPEYFPSVRRTWSGQSPVELPARDENVRTESPERNEGELSPAGSQPTTPHEHRRMVSYP